MKHSLIPPSSAARRIQCRGSARLEALFPKEDSPHASEGRAAHWVALQVLQGTIVATADRDPEGEIITPEMIDGAALYDGYVKTIIKDINKNSVGFEAPLIAPSINSNAWGTCDCFAYDKKTRCLHIIDYKFGHGFVPVINNWQLIYYAVAAIDTYYFSAETIVLHIVQPRYYGAEGKIRSWKITREDLKVYIDFLKSVEAEALEDNAPLKTGPECLFCSARHKCSELQEAAAVIADFTHATHSNDLTPTALARELKTLLNAQELLQSRITGLAQEAESLLISGTPIPGFRLQPGRSTQVWNKSAEEIIELGKLLGVNVAKPPEVITPKQAIKAKIPEEIVNVYSKVIPGKLKLTEDRKLF